MSENFWATIIDPPEPEPEPELTHDTLDVSRDADGNSITITHEQGAAIWHAIGVWAQTFFEAQGSWPTFNEANLMKSCLLGRMLYEGKPPLKVPPPTNHAAPWYSLLEEGQSDLSRDAVYFPDTQHVLICGMQWAILDRSFQPNLYVVTYGDSNIVGKWVLRTFKVGEPRGEDWDGAYFEWRLERYSPVRHPTVNPRL